MTLSSFRSARAAAPLFLAAWLGAGLSAQQVPVVAPAESVLDLVHGRFDPLRGEPVVPAALRGDQVGLQVVQFAALPTEADRVRLRAIGEVHSWLPENAYVVRATADRRDDLRAVPGVRWVGAYRPAWRLEPLLVAEHEAGVQVPARDYYVVVVDKRNDKPALSAGIQDLGGQMVDLQDQGLLCTVKLDGGQLVAAAHLDQVLWIESVTERGEDMDNARIQGGADYIENVLRLTGQGVRGHVFEGVEATHYDFTTPMTNVLSGGAAQTHGHATAGIVFGNGSSNPAVRGMAPDAVGFYTNYSSFIGSRNSVVGTLANSHQVMFTTASWGDARTRAYTAVSADADDIIFDHRMPWTQSQSNAGNQDSRPQAWAKNIFSIGGVAHRDNADPSDDSWAGGGGSTGPAADGRIKPDLCAYYDNIGTSDRTGSAGYSSGDWTSNFGGTSGATPIVAGHNAIAIQMYTDGLFGNTLPAPGGTRFQNRPLAQTLKALQIANAAQYSFTAGSSDNRREHQGWGFPSLRNMYDNSNATLIVPEDDVLTQGQTSSYTVTVVPGEPELKVSMTFVEPAGNPSAAQAIVNDLSLRVVAPDGTFYWGNNGLESGNFSTSGGSANSIDSVENVFVQGPAPGQWTIEIRATRIVTDAHVATPAVDATYALVAVGVDRQGILPGYTPYGTGCGAEPDNTVPQTFYETFGSFDLANQVMRFTPNANGDWVVTPGAGSFETNLGTDIGAGDDTLRTGYALGFSFPLAGGGTTTSIDIDSNGWIGLISGQHSGSDYTESSSEFLGNPARIAAMWDDLNPSRGGGVHFNALPGRAVITWSGVPEFSATGSNTAQIQLYPNGEVVLAYQGCTVADCLVGYSRGNGAPDSGSLDLTSPGGDPPVTLALSGTPRIGTTVGFELAQLPAGATGAIINLGFQRLNVPLDRLGMTGCTLLCTADVGLSTQPLPGGRAGASIPIPNDPALIGASMQSQGVVVAQGVNRAGLLTSNGGTLVFGN